MSSPLILIVEDDDDIRDSLAEILAESGYRTVTAPDGQAALDLLATRINPALILLDMMMPKMTGDVFLAKQRAIPDIAVIPVIVLSAGSSEAMNQLKGISGWVAKPFPYAQLISAIKGALGGGRSGSD